MAMKEEAERSCAELREEITNHERLMQRHTQEVGPVLLLRLVFTRGSATAHTGGYC